MHESGLIARLLLQSTIEQFQLLNVHSSHLVKMKRQQI